MSSTVQATVAGVGSTFPSASIARTAKVCWPGASVYAAGEEQAAKAAPSSEHSKLEPPSEEAKAKLVDSALVVPGPDEIVVSGGVLSTVTATGAEVPTLPAASCACTVSVCGPLAPEAQVTL